MKKYLFILVGLALSVFASAQNTESRDITPFDKVKVIGEIKVYLQHDSVEHISVKTYDMPTSDIHTEVKGKTLEVALKANIYKSVKADIYVYYRELRDISLSAAASVSLNDTLTGDKVVINANTSSEFDGGLNVETADIVVGQGSTVRIRGAVKNYEAKVNTGGILSALDLVSDSTFVTVSTGAIAKVNASQLIDAKVRTGGSLTYTGNPKQKKINTLMGATIVEQ
jgi:hypothetical protein